MQLLALPLLLALSFSAFAGGVKSPTPTDPFTASPTPPKEAEAPPVVRVNATNQSYDMQRPWLKRPPFPRRGTGSVLEGGYVLVTAELLNDHRFVELETPSGGTKCPAEVIAIDHDANLALLAPSDPEFLAPFSALQLAAPGRVGEEAEILQIESNGSVARTPATISSIEVAPYPLGTLALLTYKLRASLQKRDNSFTVPALHEGNLLGLLMRYDGRSQTAELLPSPIIRKFLEQAGVQPYQGFPRAGVAFAPTRDPQLRKYLGLEGGGVYVTQVLPNSPAEEAGVQRGDIIHAVNDYPIDPDGLYEDRNFGKIQFSHLVAMRRPNEDLNLHLFREGKPVNVSLPYTSSIDGTQISRPHLRGEAPDYVVLGGLVFQELSRPYLMSWGRNWKQGAPQRLVYLDTYQNELPTDHGRVILLTDVLPSPDTIGYEGIRNTVVTHVNGKPVRSLRDLAQAADHPLDGFHKIDFEEDPGTIYLDASAVEKNSTRLLNEYRLPALQRLAPLEEEKAPPATES